MSNAQTARTSPNSTVPKPFATYPRLRSSNAFVAPYSATAPTIDKPFVTYPRLRQVVEEEDDDDPGAAGEVRLHGADVRLTDVGMTIGPPPAPPAAPGRGLVAQGPHTGRLLAALPVLDLKQPGAGKWNARVKWKQSTVADFDGEPALRVSYARGSGTSSDPRHEASGMAIDSKPAGLVGAAGAVVAFDVYFDPARWHWSKGGKLGGLFVGSGKASGGRHTEDGASHRLMWKAGGGAISYIYVPKGLPQSRPELRASKDFGIGVHADVFAGALKTGQWNHVEIGLRVNTFDASGRPAGDGASSLTINGRTAELAGVNWAARPGTAISGFDFNTFFGGPDPAVVDSIAYVKNFALYEWK